MEIDLLQSYQMNVESFALVKMIHRKTQILGYGPDRRSDTRESIRSPRSGP